MSKKLRQELVKKIESAFADTPYPGDENLVNLYHNDVFCHECAEIKEIFKGKEWKTVAKETLARYYASLSLFKPQAYRYYLPAFLIAPLQLIELKTADNLPPSIVFSLSPRHKEEDYFQSRIRGFNAAQKSVITEFLEFYVQRTADSDKTLRKALRFWRERT
jgi:hypothetical protein